MEQGPARSFEDLFVWQRAHQFVIAVYRATQDFPSDELYGLTSQFRRAAVSITANIAEGFKRRGVADKLRFLNISESSLEECRYYIILARDLGYGNVSNSKEILEEASRLLSKYRAAIQKDQIG
ncbi:four helix bundle protein [bacterium]|jgi:four helix bundle protein|nr:four helix bundle protein [bacterium]